MDFDPLTPTPLTPVTPSADAPAPQGETASPSASFEKTERRAYRLGIEEEYFLVDGETKRVVIKPPADLFASAGLATEGLIGREFLQSQIEVATPPFDEISDARGELAYIRRLLSAFASERGMTILACGTHPTAVWRSAVQSEKDRYLELMHDLQMIGRRNMLCGMHVHVEVPEPEGRVDIMARMLEYLPLFLALSTSSPFWQSEATGLKGYRLAAYDELPRTGIPELFRTNEEFDAYVDALVRSEVIADASYLWWSIRPSLKYPTLELRAPDCCTRIADSVAIASLYRVLVRHLHRNPAVNDDVDIVGRALAVENKWRAQRYGVGGTFATKDGAISVADFLEEVIAMTSEDAEVLGCTDEVARCRVIAGQGTSADEQLRIFEATREKSGDEAALSAVLSWIGDHTEAG